MYTISQIVWKFFEKTKLADLLTDETYLKYLYRAKTGKRLDLKDPVRFNEKLQWLKLHDRDPLYTTMVDKFAVKEYVSKLIGSEYVVPCLGVWEQFEDIDFDKLPDRFVLKCTHDSGGLYICKDKTAMNVETVKAKLTRHLQRNYYLDGREWPYKNVKPRIIAEPYLEDAETRELRDYKFFCFGGVPKLVYIATDRQKMGEETKFDFFDMQFAHLPIRNGHPNATVPPQKPVCFDKMKELAEMLSKNIPQVRVDFFEVNGKVYFSELTFSHMSGTLPFEPDEWDTILGSWIDLPPKTEPEGK